MQDCCFFTCSFSWTLGSLSKFSWLKSFFRYYFGRCSSELAQLVPLPFSRERSTRYSDRLHDFSITIPRCYKNVDVNSFFPRTARSWNSLPIQCFLLTYNLHSFRPRISRQLFFLVTLYLVVAVQLCMEWIPIKKKNGKKWTIMTKNSVMLHISGTIHHMIVIYDTHF